MRMWWRASSALYFRIPIQTHRSTRHCTCIFMVANPVLKPEAYTAHFLNKCDPVEICIEKGHLYLDTLLSNCSQCKDHLYAMHCILYMPCTVFCICHALYSVNLKAGVWSSLWSTSCQHMKFITYLPLEKPGWSAEICFQGRQNSSESWTAMQKQWEKI